MRRRSWRWWRRRRFVGGALDGESLWGGPRLVYLEANDPDGKYQVYKHDGRFYVYQGHVSVRNPGKGMSVTLRREPSYTLVPL